MSGRRGAGPWDSVVAPVTPAVASPASEPVPIFRGRIRTGAAGAASIAVGSVAAGSGFAWLVSGNFAALLVVAVAAAMIGAGFGVGRRRKLVTMLSRSGDDLLIETLFRRRSARPLRARIADTEGWRSYVETMGHLGVKTHNRLVVFRHRGIAYAIPVDHGETIDRAALAELLGRGDAAL